MNYENMLVLKSRINHYHAGAFLDVAVGRGEFLKFALESFKSWQSAAGIDDDPDVLEIAKNELAGTPAILVRSSALAMPFTNAYFDTITMSNALHHIEDLASLFSETSRVCKPNGLVIVNEMLNENISEVDETYMLYHRLISEIDHQNGRYHRDTYTLKELLSLIKGHSFVLLDYFIHAEETGDRMNKSEIDAISNRLRKKAALLKGSDYYYFYENKVQEVIHHFEKTGIQRPRHATFFLQNK